MVFFVSQDMVGASWNWRKCERDKTGGRVATHMVQRGYLLKDVSDDRKGVVTPKISKLKCHPQPLRQSHQCGFFSAEGAPP
jgi:hypothetical protein